MLKNRRQIFLLIFGLVIASLFIVGCGGKKEAAVEKGKTVTLRFTFWGNPEQVKLTEQIVAEFEKENPDIKIRMEHIPRDYPTKMMTMIAGGTAPDVGYVEITQFSAWAHKGVLENLDPYVAKSEVIKKEDFFPRAWEVFTYDGKVYGISRDLSPTVMFFNKNHFDEAGLAYPDESWNWDIFLENVKKLTKDENGDGRTDQFGTAGYTMESAIWQNGGAIFDDEFNPTKCLLDSKEAKEALQWLQDLSWKHHVSPTPKESQDQTAEMMFTTNKVSTYFTGHWMIPTFKEIKDFTWDTAPLPKGKAGRATIHGGTAFAIFTQSKHKEEAWRFIEFIAGPKGQRIKTALGRIVPTIKEVANSEVYLGQTPPDNQQVFLDAIEYARRLVHSPKTQEVQTKLGQSLNLFWLNRETVDQAVAKAVRELNAVIAK